jgi:hypothetical protein
VRPGEDPSRLVECDVCAGTRHCTQCDGDAQCHDCWEQNPGCEVCAGTNVCVDCDGDGRCAPCRGTGRRTIAEIESAG